MVTQPASVRAQALTTHHTILTSHLWVTEPTAGTILAQGDTGRLVTLVPDPGGVDRCRIRVIDTFGTEPAYNHEEYATLHGYRTNWGYWNLNPKQFMTMFRECPALGSGGGLSEVAREEAGPIPSSPSFWGLCGEGGNTPPWRVPLDGKALFPSLQMCEPQRKPLGCVGRGQPGCRGWGKHGDLSNTQRTQPLSSWSTRCCLALESGSAEGSRTKRVPWPLRKRDIPTWRET